MVAPMVQPAAVLGPDHPLVRTSGWLAVLVRDALIVGALLSVSAGALLAGVTAALAYVVTAALALLADACAVAILARRLRARALDLIIGGRGELPLAPVERERRRLLAPGFRCELAARLDAVRRAAECPDKGLPVRARSLFRAEVVAIASSELRDVVELLHRDRPGLRGIALASRLFDDVRSPLYGSDVRALIEELRRIRFLLRHG